MKRILLTSFIIGIFLLAGTSIAVFYARGYRFLPGQDGNTIIKGTGLLVVTSNPDGAKVFVNDHLTTATNTTVNLPEGDYEIRITKDGYSTWKKKITINNEVVSKANALLFPNAPRLESITLTGASNPVADPLVTFLAFTVASSSADKNGIYILDMNGRSLLNLGVSATQIATDLQDSFSRSTLEFSPDGAELLSTISGKLKPTTYLLTAKNFNSQPRDVTTTLFSIDRNWRKLKSEKDQKLVSSLSKKELISIVSLNFSNMIFSPDHDKILYTASSAAQLPIFISPPLKGTNSTPEQRNISSGNTYVYDIKEDRNYLIEQSQDGITKTFYRWHPDSEHLIYVQDKKIIVEDYDGSNKVTVYAGPFEDDLVFPWTDGSSLVVLTNLNIPDTPSNLYRIVLK